MSELHHGGRLREAAERYSIAPEQWLDLSTGINPRGWPVPPLPAACWQRLPETNDGLEQAAAAYFGTASLLPVAGSQAAIQALPALRGPSRIGMLAPCYAEHPAAWQRKGHRLITLSVESIERRLQELDVLLLVNPNNPTGERFTPTQLLEWHQQLAARGGWLVVDEAFIDATPENSLAEYGGAEGLVVLRSLGKFFGLAGARVGFVLAWPELLQRLAAILGPWAVSGPAREVARLALEDVAWQAQTRLDLAQQSRRLHRLLQAYDLPPAGGSALFCYCPTTYAAELHEALASEGILSRLFDVPSALRFGLPGDDAGWQRLERALRGLVTIAPQKVLEC